MDRPIKFGYVDISNAKNLDILTKFCGNLSIKFTPSVIMYGSDKSDPIEYTGDYNWAEIGESSTNYCDTEGFAYPEEVEEEVVEVVEEVIEPVVEKIEEAPVLEATETVEEKKLEEAPAKPEVSMSTFD